MRLGNLRFEKEGDCLWVILNERDHDKLYPDDIKKLKKFLTKKKRKPKP